MAEQGTPGEVHINPFKKLSELFKKKVPTETKPAVTKPTKINGPKDAETDDDPGYMTIISPGTGFPHRIPRDK